MDSYLHHPAPTLIVGADHHAAAERRRELAQLYDTLGRAHARIDALARELTEEQALTRRLRGVIALLPYNAGRRPRLRRR